MKTQKHIEERIEHYLDGRLTNHEIEELWVEFLKCPEYIDHLKVNLALRELARKKTKKPLIGKNYQPLLISAAVMLIILVINFTNTTTQSPSLVLTNIELSELETPYVTRSLDQGFIGADSLLHEAFNFAVLGDKDKSFQIYNEIINESSHEASIAAAYLNKGILQFNEKQYDDAEKSLRAAIEITDDDAVEEKAYWFLGNTYANLSFLNEARESINHAYRLEGAYQDEAREMLRHIDSSI